MEVLNKHPGWNVFFVVLELACVPLILWWSQYCHLPSPGWAVAFIAGAAAAMSVHDDMRSWQKGLWILVIGAFLVTELRAINKDRNETQQQVLDDRETRDKDFRKVLHSEEEDFKKTAKGLSDAYALSEQQFEAIMQKSDMAIKGIKTDLLAVTGENSYPIFQVTEPFLPTSAPSASGARYQLDLIVVGQYPIRNLAADIEIVDSPGSLVQLPVDKNCSSCWAEYFKNREQTHHAIIIREADESPKIFHDLADKLPRGSYIINSFSLSGAFSEDLTITTDRKGEMSQTIEVFKNGNPLLHEPLRKLIGGNFVPVTPVNGKHIPQHSTRRQ